MHHARCIGLIPAHAGKTTSLRTAFRLISAHPRSRGENETLTLRIGEREGSSPLTRGKRSSLLATPQANRLIPAHAGKTGLSFVELQGAWAHPRSRGENGYQVVTDHDDVGSSPLTRGKRIRALIQARHDGLIPAHAGKTGRQTAHQRNESAHPRSRGENLPIMVSVPASGGSSPLTRGKLSFHSRREPFSRLIPAHAGKTPVRR